MEDTRPAWGIKLSRIIFIPQRIILALMLLLAIINAFTMRGSLSMAITRIVIKRNTSAQVAEGGICEPDKDDEEWEGGVQDWSQHMQGFAMSSFYIGYIMTHIPGGVLADKLGGKYVLSLGILSTSFFTLITPLAINEGGIVGTILCRVLMGFGEGTTFPAVSNLLAKWIPPHEMSFIGSMVLGGSILGTVISNFSSGWILSHWQWPMVFYIMGSCGILWFLIFTLLCFSNPLKHPYIKTEEREYLLDQLGSLGTKKNLPPTPWRDVFLSVPFLTMLLAQLGHDWGFFVMTTDLPKYMNDVMQFSIQKNGSYSALPFLCMYLCILSLGYVSKALITKGLLTVDASRKINTAIGAVGPGIFMVAASYGGCNRLLVVLLFTICLALMSPYYVGLRLNPMDMSPNYAGFLMAIGNGFSAITGACAPPIIGLMTPDTSLFQWRIAFWLSFGILALSVLPYVIFGSSNVQPWNEGTQRKKAEA